MKVYVVSVPDECDGDCHCKSVDAVYIDERMAKAHAYHTRGTCETITISYRLPDDIAPRLETLRGKEVST